MRYLRAERPDALFAAMPTPNLLAVWARRLAGVPTRVLVSERNTLSAMLGGSRRWRDRHLPRLLGHAYRLADGIVAVSDGVADDLARQTGLPRARIATVYNPVITPELAAMAGQPVAHRWFLPAAPPVVLGVGSLSARKDFPTLVRAFARLRAERDCRLVILGEAASPKKTAGAAGPADGAGREASASPPTSTCRASSPTRSPTWRGPRCSCCRPRSKACPAR